jgi:SHS2 domain-containing protein
MRYYIVMKYNYFMVSSKRSGFEELPHTADWAMRVWAVSLPALFAEAACGMNALSGAKPTPGKRIARIYTTEAPDLESLLVEFLSELVWAVEQEKLVYDKFKVTIEGTKLIVHMSGAPILSINKSIKAVTYHNLRVNKTENGFQVEIVFDV